jgi:hypothetical protein
MAPARPNQFKMMLSDEELETLRELAEEEGLTASDYLRTIIRDRTKRQTTEERFEDKLDAFAKRIERIGGGTPRAKAAAAKARDGAEKLRRARKG